MEYFIKDNSCGYGFITKGNSKLDIILNIIRKMASRDSDFVDDLINNFEEQLDIDIICLDYLEVYE